MKTISVLFGLLAGYELLYSLINYSSLAFILSMSFVMSSLMALKIEELK